MGLLGGTLYLRDTAFLKCSQGMTAEPTAALYLTLVDAQLFICGVCEGLHTFVVCITHLTAHSGKFFVRIVGFRATSLRLQCYGIVLWDGNL